ncbi:TPA: hypothetical protein ACLGNK_004342 [Salmonella enterica]
MAERHSIDLPPGSQDLSSAFLRHCMNYGEPWFIKDENERYLLHSSTIPALFGRKKQSFIGLTDHELHLLSSCYRNNQTKINFIAITKHAKVISLEIHRFENLSVFTPLVFITTPFLFNDYVYAFSRVVDVCSLRALNFISREYIFDNQNGTDSTLEIPISHFIDMAPMKTLTDSQWETLWLCLMGFSYRKVADLTGRNLKNTVKIINRSLKNLNLHTLNNFIHVSKLYGWERYIPEGIQKHESSEIIKIEEFPIRSSEI